MEEFYLDAILMPLSLFLVVGYHVYLWQCFKNKTRPTTMGIQSDARRAWFERVTLQGGDEIGKSMQIVQSLRNNLMIIIFRASISILISSSVAALTNNAYKASGHGQVFKSKQVFGSQSNRVYAVKYAAAFLVALWSFLCSCFGVGFLVDTCILVGTTTGGDGSYRPSPTHIQRLVERGFTLAFVGNRLMWVSLGVLLWPLGPIAVALCSLALVWGFSVMDFIGTSSTTGTDIDLE